MIDTCKPGISPIQQQNNIYCLAHYQCGDQMTIQETNQLLGFEILEVASSL